MRFSRASYGAQLILPGLRTLAVFAGLVTALFWTIGLGVHWALDPEAFTDPSDYVGAVLFFWIFTVLPSLVVPPLHALLATELIDRAGRHRERIASVAAALAFWPLLLLSDGFRSAIAWWGIPLAILLGVYGWTRAGALGSGRTRIDLAIERAGLAISSAVPIGFLWMIS